MVLIGQVILFWMMLDYEKLTFYWWKLTFIQEKTSKQWSLELNLFLGYQYLLQH